MFDAKTISATLTLALIGCTGSTPPPDGPNGNATATGTAETAPTGEATANTAAPAETAAPQTSASPTSAPSAAAMALPMGRPEPMPPKDGKIMKGKDSTRTGAMACCGQGTCGDCTPLPAKRTAPMPAKDGKVVAPAKSVRKGADACCGQ